MPKETDKGRLQQLLRQIHDGQESQSRRSSRVHFDVDVLVELRTEKVAHAGEAVVVNMHGALIRTSAGFQLGDQVTIHVHRTGKSAPGHVVFTTNEVSHYYGIKLDEPANIWGLSDIPLDWQECSQC